LNAWKTVAFIFFATIIVFSGCEKKSEISVVKNAPVVEPDQKFIKSRIVITENGLTSAIVEAESVKVFAVTNISTFEGGIKMDIFNKQGKHVSTLTANRGEVYGLYEKVDSLKAKGNVVVVSEEKKSKLETASSLVWIQTARRIYADSLVKLTGENAVEQGINFTAKDDLTEYSMENVSGSFEGKDIKIPGK
jgi:LPS export ABC transporter protein LptC